MQLVRKFRIPALFCALCVLACELISHPSADMGVCDEMPYFVMVRHLFDTGRVIYNGWAAPMLTWQLYFADVLVRLFGFSFDVIRMSTIIVAMAMAFILQRTMVRVDISERNATIGTLAFVLSPLYLMLSATFMTDIHGLFAVLLCLYGCVRALQSETSGSAIAWICFSVVANAMFGTSRQIAWLGILVMVPSALWLLRAQRRVFVVGAGMTLIGIAFITACMHWLKQQPYITPERLIPHIFPVAYTTLGMVYALFDLPLLLLPIIVLFLPEVRRSRRSTITIVSIAVVFYIVGAVYTHPPHHVGRLEPTMQDIPGGNWVNTIGLYEGLRNGAPHAALGTPTEIVLTLLCAGSVFGLISSSCSPRAALPIRSSSCTVTWHQLGVLLLPFSFAYTLLLVPRATTFVGIFDRYLLELAAVFAVCLCRYYQEAVRPAFPAASIFFVAISSTCGIFATHNTFSLDRARVVLAAELRARGIPDTSVDNGWEYNLGTELRHAPSINYPTIYIPANFYVKTPNAPEGTCAMSMSDYTPHIHPLYGVSFDPNACYGPASFFPVHYSRWPYLDPETLYVVRYTPAPKS